MVYKQHEISSRTLSKKESNLVEQINTVFPLIENVIEDVQNGNVEGANEKQLVKIKKELAEMIKYLNPRDYMPGFGHIIADCWDPDWELGEVLLNVIAKYKKL